MIASDTYKTIKAVSQGIFKEKGSRFISFAVPVSSLDEIKPLLEDFRKKYHDARHHCYGFMFGADRTVWRANDDGEPSGTAGKPILGQINSFGLTNLVIIVIRYFGGTLLGTSGLINAYKSAAYESIINSEIIECTINDYYKIDFPYHVINDVMKVLKDLNINHTDQTFDLACSIKISYRLSLKEIIHQRLSVIAGLKLTYLETR
jgi:uncharacterized YigZ family protein